MADISKQKFTNATLGRPILVTTNASPGTAIHTVTTNSSQFDEVWLYAANNGTTNVALTVEFGSNSSADQINAAIPFKSGLYLLIPGIPLQGNTTASTVKAYTNTVNVVSISGWVNRLG
jgi:orotidine-5'-phosphate decarboxylase